MISRSVFLQGINRLEIAFGYKVSEKQFDLYYEKLSSRLNSETFMAVIEDIIETESRFPSISVFWNKSAKPDNY